jgi:hypothetical protein
MGISCALRVPAPLGGGPVRRRIVRAFEDISRRWEAGILDQHALSVAKELCAYEGSLMIVIGTFAGIFHGDKELGGTESGATTAASKE